jgi:hypothetical protein
MIMVVMMLADNVLPIAACANVLHTLKDLIRERVAVELEVEIVIFTKQDMLKRFGGAERTFRRVPFQVFLRRGSRPFAYRAEGELGTTPCVLRSGVARAHLLPEAASAACTLRAGD